MRFLLLEPCIWRHSQMIADSANSECRQIYFSYGNDMRPYASLRGRPQETAGLKRPWASPIKSARSCRGILPFQRVDESPDGTWMFGDLFHGILQRYFRDAAEQSVFPMLLRTWTGGDVLHVVPGAAAAGLDVAGLLKIRPCIIQRLSDTGARPRSRFRRWLP